MNPEISMNFQYSCAMLDGKHGEEEKKAQKNDLAHTADVSADRGMGIQVARSCGAGIDVSRSFYREASRFLWK